MNIVCISQITVENANGSRSSTYACWHGRKHPDPSGNFFKHGQLKSKVLSRTGLLLYPKL